MPERPSTTTTSIRVVTIDDFDAIVGWLADPATNRFLVSAWRDGAIDRRMLAMTLRSSSNELCLIEHEGEPCGLVGLSDIDATDSVAMIWYLVGRRDLQGRGIASDSVAQMCRRAFSEMGLRCVYAWVMAPNLGSIRVLEKNGFARVGRMRQATTLDGEPVDRIYFDRVAD